MFQSSASTQTSLLLHNLLSHLQSSWDRSSPVPKFPTLGYLKPLSRNKHQTPSVLKPTSSSWCPASEHTALTHFALGISPGPHPLLTVQPAHYSSLRFQRANSGLSQSHDPDLLSWRTTSPGYRREMALTSAWKTEE